MLVFGMFVFDVCTSPFLLDMFVFDIVHLTC